MLELLPKLPLFPLFRKFGLPPMLPVSLTVSLTNRCNSRCKTCNIYRKDSRELSLEEYRSIFDSIGRAPYWITFSGGEPFLRKDIADICVSACASLRPRIINIPTNGLLTERIEHGVRSILEGCPGTLLIVNLSLDGIGDRHDRIRGVEGCFEKAMETYRRLRAIDNRNLTLGIHTVISRFNVDEIPDIYRELKKLGPDSYITEIAEERVELGTVGSGITPPAEAYAAAVDFITADMKHWDLKGISRLTRAFRRRYYRMVKAFLRGESTPAACYAGAASCQIAPDGEVWACCIKAESMGNLRETGYDFKRLWFSERARRIRRDIAERTCACPLANAAYTNMLFSPVTLAGVALEVLTGYESSGNRRNGFYRKPPGGQAG